MPPPAGVQGHATALLNRLEGALVRSLRMAEAATLEWGDPVGSTLLAAVAARHAEVPLSLLVVADGGPQAAEPARRVARHLGLGLLERHVPPGEVPPLQRAVADVFLRLPVPPGAAPDDPDAVRTYVLAFEAAAFGDRLLRTAGWRELWHGATPSSDAEAEALRTDSALAHAARVKFRYPFHDPGLRTFTTHPTVTEAGIAVPVHDLHVEALSQCGFPTGPADETLAPSVPSTRPPMAL